MGNAYPGFEEVFILERARAKPVFQLQKKAYL